MTFDHGPETFEQELQAQYLELERAKLELEQKRLDFYLSQESTQTVACPQPAEASQPEEDPDYYHNLALDANQLYNPDDEQYIGFDMPTRTVAVFNEGFNIVVVDDRAYVPMSYAGEGSWTPITYLDKDVTAVLRTLPVEPWLAPSINV